MMPRAANLRRSRPRSTEPVLLREHCLNGSFHLDNVPAIRCFRQRFFDDVSLTTIPGQCDPDVIARQMFARMD